MQDETNSPDPCEDNVITNRASVTSKIEDVSCYVERSEPSALDGAEQVAPTPRRRRRLRPTIALAPPVLGGALLTAPPISFLDFLVDDDCRAYCKALFGENGTSVATALEDFRKAADFHYFGHRSQKPGLAPPNNPGLLDATRAESRKTLKAFTQFAYRGDPDRRGPLFWKRVAGLLWQAYAHLMALRGQAEKIRLQEIDRIERMSTKRDARAAYMRGYRADRRSTTGQTDQPGEAARTPGVDISDGSKQRGGTAKEFVE